jgi:hypothetical protein
MIMPKRVGTCFLAFLVAIFMLFPRKAEAYGLSTHLLIVDLLWDSDIKPLLEQAYKNPNPDPSTDAAFYESARQYAYAGALLQDAGYYLYIGTHKNTAAIKQFSDATHYVRSGDFVSNLFRNATDMDELALALGALTHYVGDVEGHSMATNLSVALRFPALRQAHGDSVDYESCPDAHREVEFGFDVNAAKLLRLRPPVLSENEKPNLALEQLAYSFYQTYGLNRDLSEPRQGFSAKAYYRSAGALLPTGTYAKASENPLATADSSAQSKPIEGGLDLKTCGGHPLSFFKAVDEGDAGGLQSLVAPVSASEQWDTNPPVTEALLERWLVNRIHSAAVVAPTIETQTLYAKSVVLSVEKLREIIATIPHSAQESRGHFVPIWTADERAPQGPLPNFNLDTGKREKAGDYRLSDEVHLGLLLELSMTKTPRWAVPAGMVEDLNTYLSDPSILKPPAPADVQKQMDRLHRFKLGDACPRPGFGGGSSDNVGSGGPSIPGLCDTATP